MGAVMNSRLAAGAAIASLLASLQTGLPASLLTGLSVSLLAGLSACAVGPNFKRPAPPAATGYGSAPAQGQTTAADAAGGNIQQFVPGMDIPSEWWTLFHSPKLDRLVEQALKANPDVGAAQAALRQAHELYSAQRTSFFPELQGNFNGVRAKNAIGTIANPTSLPQTNPYYTLYTAQLSLSYTPDVFGATRRQVEIAKAQFDSSRFQLEAVYLTLSSNVVVTAVQEASLRGQIGATMRLLDLQHQLTEIVKHQRVLGTASDLDVLAQTSAEAQTAQTLPPLQKQLGQ
jgi:outer membrane protein TolC